MIGWAPPHVVALYSARPVRTIRTWAATNQIPSACDIQTHQLVVNAEAARRHAETRPTRKRLLTRAS